MSTLDKYRRLQQEPPKNEENEIRVTGRGRVGMYIAYAAKLFLEKQLKKCVIKGSGPAISKVCQTAEILRQRIKGLYEQSRIYSTNVTDVYEPLEEGLDKVEVTKSLTVYEVTLSLDEKEIDKNSYGYQEPLPEKDVTEFKLDYGTRQGGARRGGRRGGSRGFRRGGRGRGMRRGGRGGQRQYYDDNENYNRPPPRYRRPPRYNDDYDYDAPRRGRGRRQYNEEDDYYRPDNRRRQQQRYDDDDYYYEEPPRRGRGNRRGGRPEENRDKDYNRNQQSEPKTTRRPYQKRQ